MRAGEWNHTGERSDSNRDSEKGRSGFSIEEVRDQRGPAITTGNNDASEPVKPAGMRHITGSRRECQCRSLERLGLLRRLRRKRQELILKVRSGKSRDPISFSGPREGRSCTKDRAQQEKADKSCPDNGIEQSDEVDMHDRFHDRDMIRKCLKISNLPDIDV
jgi:hypothetical protein